MQTVVLNLINGQTMVASLEKKEDEVLTLKDPFFIEIGQDALGTRSVSLGRVTTFSNTHTIQLEEDKALLITSPSKATRAVYESTLKTYEEELDSRIDNMLAQGLDEYMDKDTREYLKEKMEEIGMKYALRNANTSVMH